MNKMEEEKKKIVLLDYWQIFLKRKWLVIIAFDNKDLGIVLTPSRTSDYIVSKLGHIKENQKVLDPCVGPGVFIKSLLKAGVKRSKIYAYDLNPCFKNSSSIIN